MRGEYVVNIDQLDNAGWWKGTSESGGTGIFPSNFVQLVETEEKAPQRPPRARPATVKSENSPPSSLASPPPVPVTTRPTSLLTSRQASSNSSSGVPVVAPPRPTTTPPRPTTSPPVPTSMTNSPPVPTRRLNNMTISTDSKNSSHKRTPSIPLVSPDLPPMSPGFERPTRTLPTRPTSVNDTSPTDKPGPHHLAKPPKVNFGNKSTPLNRK